MPAFQVYVHLDDRLRSEKLDACSAGKPVFGTLIALLRDGVPVLGVIDQPITKERWLGVQGRPTTLNGEGQIAKIVLKEVELHTKRTLVHYCYVLSGCVGGQRCLPACQGPVQGRDEFHDGMGCTDDVSRASRAGNQHASRLHRLASSISVRHHPTHVSGRHREGF